MTKLLFGAAALALVGGPLAYAADCTPEAVHVTAPSFQPAAMHSGDADATIAYRIGADGRTHDIAVSDTYGDPTFTRAAVSAVRDWRFDTAACASGDQVYSVRLSYLPSSDPFDDDSLKAALNPQYGMKPVNVASTDVTEIVVSPARDARMQAATEQGKLYGEYRGTPVLSFRMPAQ
jgi:hypothetical protein